MNLLSFLNPWRSSYNQSENNNSNHNGNIPKNGLNSFGQSHPVQNSITNLNSSGQLQAPQPNAVALTPAEVMERRPLKYAGYPLFTRYLASSQEAMVLRRFDQLHARVLLKMQDDIVLKEESLEAIDKRLSKIGDEYVINGSFRVDAGKVDRPRPCHDMMARSALLDELKTEIRVYDETILNYRKLRSDLTPNQSNIENVKDYLHSWGYSREPGKEHMGPIWQPECEYLFKDGDLLELVPEQKAPLRRLIEQWSSFMLGPWFRSKPRGTQCYQDFRPNEEQVLYQSDDRIEGFITFISLSCGLFLLIGPLQLLNRIESDKTKLNVICVLIATFLITLGLIMPAKPWETLAATAAYSAVLMVFMQIHH